ncbi:MAG: undecaprenyl-diphosphate phosphatase [Chlorobi bacterium]|nr:undecaprenyl-diphosphate phosphatase [Chlorobiota bacterium]
MQELQAFLLGLLQGLTEFLPVSSSGHLEIGKHFISPEWGESLYFTVVVHGATVLSILVVFWKDIIRLFNGFFRFRKNEESVYLYKLLFSAIPVALLGVLFKDRIEILFSGNIHLVAWALMITAIFLTIASFVKSTGRKITWLDALIIGMAQAIAVVPGISRSGSTIATGLMLGNQREEITRFSFLMVILPVIGANFLEIAGGDLSASSSVGIPALIIGFITAFISGFFACKWMIAIVNRGKLYFFAIYCLILAVSVLLFT